MKTLLHRHAGATGTHLPAALLAACAVFLAPTVSDAADLELRLENGPAAGVLVFQVYDAADTFGDLRDPVQEFSLPAASDGTYRLSNITDGEIAVLVYHDENSNGRIDKNFIGIPREPLAISNNYQPKGPPSFARASFRMPPDEPLQIGMDMYRALGERGRFGVEGVLVRVEVHHQHPVTSFGRHCCSTHPAEPTRRSDDIAGLTPDVLSGRGGR